MEEEKIDRLIEHYAKTWKLLTKTQTRLIKGEKFNKSEIENYKEVWRELTRVQAEVLKTLKDMAKMIRILRGD